MSYTIVKHWTTAAGFRAAIIMSDLGHHCGYVGVPPNHPLHGCDYNKPCAAFRRYPMQSPEMVFDVHGGTTYSNVSDTYPVESDLWWFGYDCAHPGDRASDEHLETMRTKYPDMPFMWEDSYGTFRDADYCARECESLARQIAEKTVGAPK